MCGIAGYYGFNNQNLLKEFSKRLAHRGPDGEGFFFDDKIGLLNRRLAIIDLKTGNQPIYNEDRSVVVVYNGEIYNYQILRKKLEEKGHRFKTNSDTEVIVHLYEEEKEKCFKRFEGMFAIALYDIQEKKLILVRDQFGIKPLYYAVVNSSQPLNNQDNRRLKLIFASEIKPLFYSGLIEKKPNDRIIYRYLKFRVHDDGEETFFACIKRIMPGELIIVQGSNFKVQQYANLKKELLKKINKGSLQFQPKKESQIFRQKLTAAVKLRLIADVPVGTCFSGGLDSASIVVTINKLLKEKVEEASSIGKIQKTFSAVFPGFPNDESQYIDLLVKRLKNLKSYKVYPKPEELFDQLEEFIKTQEEPTISTGPYAQFKTMELASNYVKVVLDGQGADEMMGGYLPYYFVYLRQLLTERKIIKLAREIWGAKRILTKYIISGLNQLLGFKKTIAVDDLLNTKFKTRYLNEHYSPIVNNLKRRLIDDIFYNSLPALLRYEDKNGMRFSIESRVPFLDSELIGHLFSLSDEAIIKDGCNKFILRQATKDILPREINQRRDKIGFTTPEKEWFLRMKNRIYNFFLSESFAKRPYFNQQKILKAFEEFIAGRNDETMLFWRFLNLELWLRIFFDKDNRLNKKQKDYRPFSPNEGKKLAIEVKRKRYLRFPIKTGLFKKGDQLEKKIARYGLGFLRKMTRNIRYNSLLKKPFFLVVSEKIIAIAQGRSYFIWEIKTGFWAKFLSRYVTKTPWGIGLGSPWTMQLAINQAGLWRILVAAFFALVSRPLGIKGLFYRIAGREIAAIDGPTEYSLYPSNVSAKLGPKEPQKVARKITSLIKSQIQTGNFLGVVVIDANDLGQTVLANTTRLDNQLIESVLKDNPMGQAKEQTPIVLVACLGNKG